MDATCVTKPSRVIVPRFSSLLVGTPLGDLVVVGLLMKAMLLHQFRCPFTSIDKKKKIP